MTILTPGQEIGPYRVIEQAGKGGMATVYKAHHAGMDRYVAIKILPFQFAQNQEFNDRFRREVRVIAKLEHPRILPVYDSGEFEGTPYLVMRYLDAGTLKERIEAGKMSLEEVDRIFSQLADALSYAHSHDIVHRDIKPSNVMLTRQGDVFLTDFGIAKLIGEHTQFTASGAITGTPAYMSPEQAEGRPIDARADIYALGIVLYEMVTGRVPFEAETPLAVILKHLQAPLPPPSSLTDIHPAIEQVILKALARNREERYSHTDDLLGAWKNAVQTAKSDKATVSGAAPPLDIRAASPHPAEIQSPLTGSGAISPHPVSPKKRKVGFWIGGGLAALLILGVCGIGTFSLYRVCCTPDVPLLSLPIPEEGEGEWESWTGTEVVFSITQHDGMIYAGGLGRITVFDENWEYVDQLTIQDGLPDNRVFYLFSDEEGDGDLWAATANGVARFNGETWVVYGYEDGLDDITINFVSRVGEYIIAGSNYGPDGGGINLFDGERWTHPEGFGSTSDGDPNRFDNSVWEAVFDEENEILWVATENGVGALDGTDWKRFTTEDGLPSNFITGVMIDENGELLVSTERGAARFDGSRFQAFAPTLGHSINDIVVDSDGHYWLPGGDGVFRFNPENGNWEILEGGNGFPAYSAYRAMADEDGNVFFGTDGKGVVAFDGEDFIPLDTPPGPGRNAYWGMLEDRDGVFWFSEEYGLGIDTYDPSEDIWSDKELDVCCVIPITFDADGNLWGVGETGVWFLTPEGRATNVTSEQGLPSDQVYDLDLTEDGSLWLATETGIVKLQGFEVVEVLNADKMGLTNDRVHTLLAASDDSLWVGREGGLSHFSPDGTWEHFEIGTLFSSNFSLVTRIAEHPDGSIWVTTFGDGVYQRLPEGEWAHYTPNHPGVLLPSLYVNGVNIAPDGALWFGTDYGVARFDGGSWQAWDIKDGLGHWNVNQVYVQQDGTIWFVTSGGITRWMP